jgi:streptomycin 6-kinase
MRYDQAERLFAELLSSAAAQVLLHGDLHHFNILSAERSPWLAIDPKGVIGEPAYEAGALLRNPFPKLLDLDDPGRLLSRRVSILAEALDLDARRIRGWAVAQAVLAAVWSIEDDESVNDYWVTCADLLAEGDLG